MRHALRDLLAVGDPMDEQRLADDLSTVMRGLSEA